MRASVLAASLGLAALISSVQNPARANDDIVLRGMGSFHIGGRIAEISGKPVRDIQRQPGGPISKFDPNGQYMVEQMYVQYFLPKNRKGKLPLLMWHGGGLTGVTYESTPDGREGWLNMFVRYGWDVYNSDAVERGRSGFAPPEVWPAEPTFLPYQDPFERFRIGDGPGSWNSDPAKAKVIPGSQFPVEAYANYMRQTVPRWVTTDAAIIAAYVALVDKICPCVMLTHSQGGAFGFKVAEQRPDKIKAIVAVESATAGIIANAPKLKDVPVLMIFGDYVDQHPRWAAFKKTDTEYVNAIKAAGGTVDWINLPEIGIKGNSHMLMQDRNNGEIAAVIQKWLVGKGLSE
jgi:pimeloyl-ACP methyl ester carboxylesterase